MTSHTLKKNFDKLKEKKETALITYTVAGDPDKETSLEILKSIAKSGANIIEIGLAHNTPIGDGKEIQNSAHRAISNGILVKDLFDIIEDFKKNYSTDIIIMTYYNMILQFGADNFVNECRRTKVSGIICVDLPWPENKEFAEKCKNNSISFIQLVAPTTSKERLNKIIKDSHEMIYYISMLSTTGGDLKSSPEEILENYNDVKNIDPSKKYVIGFGITENTISALKSADGLVVGSVLCKEITKSIKSGQNPVTNVANMIVKLKNKIQ